MGVNSQRLRYLLVVGRFGQFHELFDFALQLRFRFLDAPITQCAVYGCVGFELAVVQRDVAEIGYLHAVGKHQDWHHQSIDLFQKAFAEGVQNVVVRIFVSGYKAKCNRTES